MAQAWLGTQFTCFTDTKVRILTQAALLEFGVRSSSGVELACERHARGVEVLSLLASLVKKYKY